MYEEILQPYPGREHSAQLQGIGSDVSQIRGGRHLLMDYGSAVMILHGINSVFR